MGGRQLVLIVIFAAHWAAFLFLLFRDRRLSLLFPIGVFTLLILTQLMWDSAVVIDLGVFGSRRLPALLRAGAIVLAVPSIGLMVRRIVLKRRGALSAS